MKTDSSMGEAWPRMNRTSWRLRITGMKAMAFAPGVGWVWVMT
ncbi:MAG: hypothetical protein ABIF71_15155 [Planctomycetota bacterium]